MDSGKKWTSGGIWVPDSEANFWSPKLFFMVSIPKIKIQIPPFIVFRDTFVVLYTFESYIFVDISVVKETTNCIDFAVKKREKSEDYGGLGIWK